LQTVISPIGENKKDKKSVQPLLLKIKMIRNLTVAQLHSILQATLLHVSDSSVVVQGIATDTRQLKPGEVFVALRGEQFDGHAFLETAAAQGAIAAIVDTEVTTELPLPLLLVPNTLQAYQAIARWWRDQFAIPVIAVTGSVGKTTTKELIAAVLATQGTVHKSQANFNNEIGVPKTLLDLAPDHDYAIVEMGMRGLGEIAELTRIARPDIAVITNVGTAHIGRLGSEQAIAQAKCELLAEMPATSVAVLNYDNPLLLETASQVWQGKTVTFGLTGGKIHGQVLDPYTLVVEDMPLPLPLPGRHHALNYLAALAVARILQVDWTPLKAGLQVELPGGRAQRYELSGDVVILDETYNAGLESMIAALHLLAATPGQRRIAVLGTMKELGERSPEFHQQVGQTVADLKLDRLFILADEPEATAMATGAAAIASDHCSNHAELVERLQQIVEPGDRLLFKASRAVGLDRVVEQLRSCLG
jgi:UDP-N-acetylmuramoyl-tripeptide--D-alanyl-D-alanine ligase